MRLWSNSIDNLRNEDWAVPLQEMGRMKRAPIFPHNIQGSYWRSGMGPVQVEARKFAEVLLFRSICIYH